MAQRLTKHAFKTFAQAAPASPSDRITFDTGDGASSEWFQPTGHGTLQLQLWLGADSIVRVHLSGTGALFTDGAVDKGAVLLSGTVNTFELMTDPDLRVGFSLDTPGPIRQLIGRETFG